MKTADATSVPVSTVMTRGVINTSPQTPLTEVADRMAGSRIHCVVVEGLARSSHNGERLVWGIVSDLDLLKAAAAGLIDGVAGDFAATEITTIDSTDTVESATELMAAHEVTHLVVVSPETTMPVGVVSSLDIAGVLRHA